MRAIKQKAQNLQTYPQRQGIFLAYKRPRFFTLAQIINLLPLTAYLYEAIWRPYSIGLLTRGGFSTSRELKLMKNWLKPKPHEVILDAGCSAGLYSRTLLMYEQSLELHMLDMSFAFLKRAKTLAKKHKLTANFVQADVAHLPYLDESFDAIVCGGSLNEFADLELSLQEFARVLKPKGKLWLMYLSKDKTPLGRAVQAALGLTGIRFIHPEQLESVANIAGLNLVKAEYRGKVAMALYQKDVHS